MRHQANCVAQKGGLMNWTDNAGSKAWYYLDIQEATNSHYFAIKANDYEKWSSLRENRDWTTFQ